MIQKELGAVWTSKFAQLVQITPLMKFNDASSTKIVSFHMTWNRIYLRVFIDKIVIFWANAPIWTLNFANLNFIQ